VSPIFPTVGQFSVASRQPLQYCSPALRDGFRAGPQARLHPAASALNVAARINRRRSPPLFSVRQENANATETNAPRIYAEHRGGPDRSRGDVTDAWRPSEARRPCDYRGDRSPGKREELRAFLLGNMHEILAAEGCQSVRFHANAEDPNVLLFVEYWDARASYDKYLAWRFQRGDHARMISMMNGEVSVRTFDVLA
jgi:quinol monooxygenase YgiN